MSDAPSRAGRSRIFTDEVMVSIPLWLKLGADRRDIAAALGTTPNSLAVICSKEGVSLRPSDVGVRQALGRERWAVLRGEAERRGTSAAQLVADIVTAVVDDKLLDAVLDDDGAGPRG